MLKLSDEYQDTPEKACALTYLDQADKLKKEFLQKTVEGFSDKVTKEEAVEKLKENWFKSYKLRMAINGKKMLDDNGSRPKDATEEQADANTLEAA